MLYNSASTKASVELVYSFDASPCRCPCKWGGKNKGVVAWCKIGKEADGGSEKGGCLVTDGMLSCATTTHFKLIVYTAEESHSKTVVQKSIASTAVLFQMERYISRSVSLSFSVCSDKNRSEKILLHKYHLKRVRRVG